MKDQFKRPTISRKVSTEEKHEWDYLQDYKGKQVALLGQEGDPILGQVIEAWADAQGIIQKIKLARADGKIVWLEVSEIVIQVLEVSNAWLPRLIRWFKKFF